MYHGFYMGTGFPTFWLAIALIVLGVIVIQAIRQPKHPNPSLYELIVSNNFPLTDEQKRQLTPMFKEIVEQKKRIINKYNEFGIITPEQAIKYISITENTNKFRLEEGFGPGCWRECERV